jgi:hypothetical protein
MNQPPQLKASIDRIQRLDDGLGREISVWPSGQPNR